MSLSCVLEYIKAFGPIAALLFGPLIAMRVYYRQKEYENTKQRYLEGCLDRIAGQLQTTLGTLSHNYARCMVICKAYRDYGAEFDVEEAAKGFIDMDNSKFLQTEHFRLQTLIGSDVAWLFYQSAMAYAASAGATLSKEIPDALRILSKKPEGTRDRAADAEKMILDARKLHDQGFVYATLQSELNTLAAILERERLGTKEVQAFSSRPAVKEAVGRMKQAYDSLPPD